MTLGAKTQRYILQERDDECEDDRSRDGFFSRTKTFQLILEDEQVDEIHLKLILEHFDNIFLSTLNGKTIHRTVKCSHCPGFFHAQKYFLPEDFKSECTVNRHQWDQRFQSLATATAVRPGANTVLGPAPSQNEGRNYALVIGNYAYKYKSFLALNSVQEDFKNIVETLASKHNYNLDMMGNLRAGVADSDFIEAATSQELINSENILDSLDDYLDRMKDELRMKNKVHFDSLMFFFLGHGVRYNNQDFLLGISGIPTSVKQVQKALQDSNCAKQYTLVLDCCREQYTLDVETDDYEPSQDLNMTVVYAAPPGLVAPDVPGKTLTSCIIKLLETGDKIRIKDLQEKLLAVWNDTQLEQSKQVDSFSEVRLPIKFPNTFFPYE